LGGGGWGVGFFGVGGLVMGVVFGLHSDPSPEGPKKEI